MNAASVQNFDTDEETCRSFVFVDPYNAKDGNMRASSR